MLKADRELLGGRHRRLLVDESVRREIFDAQSLPQWLAHEAAVPRCGCAAPRSVTPIAPRRVRGNPAPMLTLFNQSPHG